MDLPLAVHRQPDWEYLPEHVLFFIVTELFVISDMVAFSSVCNRWRTVCRRRFQEINIPCNLIAVLRRGLPLLVIPTIDSRRSLCHVYSIPDRGIYDVRLQMPYNRCIGSCLGWLIFLDTVSFMVTLYNPFYFGNARGIIHLPPFLLARDFFQQVTHFDVSPVYYIYKAILSDDPLSSPSFTVMLIYGEYSRLAYYRSGDESWTCIKARNTQFCDLIYSRGHFTIVNFFGEVFTCNLRANIPQLESICNPMYDNRALKLNQRYVVMLSNKETLVQVARKVEARVNSNGGLFYQTLGFTVYRLARVRGSFVWRSISSIGDETLFVGDSHSYSVKASSYPGIIPNAIYYSEDHHSFVNVFHKPYESTGPLDSGVYLIGEEKFVRPYMPDHIQNRCIPSIWIIPTI